MGFSTFRRAAAPALVLGIAVACADPGPTGFQAPDASAGFFPPIPTIEPTVPRLAEIERVEVCKNYVMISGAQPPATTAFNVRGYDDIAQAVTDHPFSLATGACREAWTSNGDAATVSETVPAGFLASYTITTTAGTTTGPTAGNSVTVTPTSAVGYLITFTNTEEVRETGCTLTQGYWKTHSSYGPAPYDNAWLNIGAAGAAKVFYFSGMSWYQLFWTPPSGGNAYIQLAHQYMAAKLNVLAGASTTSAVAAAISWAETFFGNSVNKPSTSYSNAQKNTIRGYASTLGSYNEGGIGPGHCQD